MAWQGPTPFSQIVARATRHTPYRPVRARSQHERPSATLVRVVVMCSRLKCCATTAVRAKPNVTKEQAFSLVEEEGWGAFPGIGALCPEHASEEHARRHQ